jgi:hypothetical protein
MDIFVNQSSHTIFQSKKPRKYRSLRDGTISFPSRVSFNDKGGRSFYFVSSAFRDCLDRFVLRLSSREGCDDDDGQMEDSLHLFSSRSTANGRLLFLLLLVNVDLSQLQLSDALVKSSNKSRFVSKREKRSLGNFRL